MLATVQAESLRSLHGESHHLVSDGWSQIAGKKPVRKEGLLWLTV